MDFPKKQAQRLMPLYLLEYSEKLFENHPDPEAPWGGGSDYTAGDGIDITNDVISVDNTIARKSDIPSLTGYATEQWVLDKGYITSTDLLGYATETWVQNQGYLTSSALTNYITTTQLEDALDDYALKTDIPENVSDLNNDAGYTTQTWVENQGYITGINSSDVIAALGYTPGTSNFSGSYNDLTDTPTIGHGVLTIQVNGVNVKQFSANETAAKTANIIVPTKTSDLTNDSGFITSSAIANDIEYIDLGSGSYNPVITQTIVDKIATNPKKYVLLYRYTKDGYTYGLNFSLVHESTTSYGYECYCVWRYNSSGFFDHCSEGFALNIGKSPLTSTLNQWTIMPNSPFLNVDDPNGKMYFSLDGSSGSYYRYVDLSASNRIFYVNLSALNPVFKNGLTSTYNTVTNQLEVELNAVIPSTATSTSTSTVTPTTGTFVTGTSTNTTNVVNSVTYTPSSETLTFTYSDNTTASFTFLTSSTTVTSGTTSVVTSVTDSTSSAMTGATVSTTTTTTLS